ncbi:MAG: phosphoribosylformylglycinamidine cyclo-ligase [Rhodothermales bacterium]|nr:phosphoribosylformylglycinamidine cyclo-ligase [Rhodothermales bacterium]
MTYEDSGVSIDAGDELVDSIKPLVRSTFRPEVLTDIGSFGGLFQFNSSDYEEPVLVSSVDGVGTKLKVAFRSGTHDTVGQDLVNHCVNDIAVCGADPLFFLDYFATGKLSPDVGREVVKGFVIACRENGCALIGGETAEMPGMYKDGEYDLAGTVVGVVEKKHIVSGEKVRKGDRLIGLPSTGLHTNGYSLARKVLFEHFEHTDTPDALAGKSVGEALLAVHRSYLKEIRLVRQEPWLHGLVHVTGGGIPGNTARIVKGLKANIDYSSWVVPPIFKLIKDLGSVPENDMRRAFNLGIGLVMVVAENEAGLARQILADIGSDTVEIGVVE